MCGIAGIFSNRNHFSAEEGESLVRQMSSILEHRGPDAEGHWCDRDCGIFFGHRRLSIQDVSEAGAQPMTSHCGRYVINYNGEVYNSDRLIQELEEYHEKINWRGHSDTEVLLESFARLGLKKTLNIVKGLFAIALWDKKDKTLTLIRDHVGKKPLYVGWIDDHIVFASELKAFKAVSKKSLEINKQALEYYNYFGFIPAPDSIYQGICKLKPGHFMILDQSDLQTKNHALFIEKSVPYWRLRKTESDPRDLKSLLLQAVKGRMISDVPLGAFLSGGIDSSLVTAMMQESSKNKIKTYSIGFDEVEYDESCYAEKIASCLGTDHTTYHVRVRDTLKIIPSLPQIYDEPFADYSQIPTAILCQQARKDTIVALSGDGGDEVFCGYKRYFMLKKFWDMKKHIPQTVCDLFAFVLSAPSKAVYDSLHMNGKRFHSIADFLKEKTLQHAILRTLSVQPQKAQPAFEINVDQLNDLEQMMMVDTHLYLPDDILVKIDRASMFSSLEVRSPLLDKDLIEYAWSLPIEEKIFQDGQRGKKPLYNLLCDYVPEELINRRKQGFTPPITQWLRGELKEWAFDLLNQDTGLYDLKNNQKLWEEFMSNKKDHHHSLWGILMAQAWFIDAHKL